MKNANPAIIQNTLERTCKKNVDVDKVIMDEKNHSSSIINNNILFLIYFYPFCFPIPV